MMRRYATLLCLVLAAAAVVTASPGISAQPYPVKPVRVIVGFPPGGGNHFIARFRALRLSSTMGQQFIVEDAGVKAE